MRSLVRVTGPAIEPLTVREVAAHLRLDESSVEPAPDAPIVALANAGAGNVDTGAHRYRLTFVTADGETDGGDISDVVTVADKTANGKVSLTSIPLGGSAVIARKLYRTAAGGSSYLLAATINNNTATTYIDNVADASLGAGAPASNTTGDPLLSSLIQASRELVEDTTHRALITQEWRATFDRFPGCSDGFGGPGGSYEALTGYPVGEPNDWRRTRELVLVPDLLTVESITYLDTNGQIATLDSSQYEVDTDSFPGRVRLAYGNAWPATAFYPNAVAVTMTRGFGPAASDVPKAITAAMKLLIGQWYENREATVDARYANEVPFSVTALLTKHRWLAQEIA